MPPQAQGCPFTGMRGGGGRKSSRKKGWKGMRGKVKLRRELKEMQQAPRGGERGGGEGAGGGKGSGGKRGRTKKPGGKACKMAGERWGGITMGEKKR